MASCFFPFNSRNLDTSFFVFKPTVVIIDDLVDALKHFCLAAEGLGCVHSAVFKSLHGSMIIWYGAWIKRSDENKELLNSTLESMLLNDVLSMAVLIDHCFFDAYGGACRDGSPAAEFFTGDTISMYSATLYKDDIRDKVSYAALAIFKSTFQKMSGAASGVCLRSQTQPRIVGICVWKSLQHCYAYILNTDYRQLVLPYLDGIPIEFKYDIFRVEYVSDDDQATLDSSSQPPFKALPNEMGHNKDGFEVVQNFKRVAE